MSARSQIRELSGPVVLRPGVTTLADWRGVYRGAAVSLDPFARTDVEAGAAAMRALHATEDGPGAPDAANDRAPSFAELVEARGASLPDALVRLFVALKLTSLAQGMSGLRWQTVRGFADCLENGLLPPVPAEAISDRAALAHLFAALTGTGEIVAGERRKPAAKALKEAGLAPLALEPAERAALLSGTQLSVAMALAGLFEAERIFQSALVASALATDALGGAAEPLHARVHRLYRQRGQMDVAAALRSLAGTSAPTNGQDARERHAALEMGACLDLLRQAGATLERAANAVTEDRLVVWQSGEAVSGIEDISSAALAADQIALALRALGDLADGRIASLTGRTPPGANGPEIATGALAVKAAGFVSENRERGIPAGLAPASMRRLLPMAGTAALVLAIEALTATRAAARSPRESGSAALQAARRVVSEAAPDTDSPSSASVGDLAAIADLVRSGALAAAPGVALPDASLPLAEWARPPLAARPKRT